MGKRDGFEGFASQQAAGREAENPAVAFNNIDGFNLVGQDQVPQRQAEKQGVDVDFPDTERISRRWGQNGLYFLLNGILDGGKDQTPPHGRHKEAHHQKSAEGEKTPSLFLH